jgi:hypothetical protein
LVFTLKEDLKMDGFGEDKENILRFDGCWVFFYEVEKHVKNCAQN